MKTGIHGYALIGTGTCKNVSVEIERALDGTHHQLSIAIRTEFIPARYQIRLGSLDDAMLILRFVSDHIGNDGSYELKILVASNTELQITKDPEQNDRFQLKIFAAGVFVEQTLGGLSAASFMKALMLALSHGV